MNDLSRFNTATAPEQDAAWSGWADQRLGPLYNELLRVREDMPDGSTEWGCISDAMKAVELADAYIEKRLKEDTI